MTFRWCLWHLTRQSSVEHLPHSRCFASIEMCVSTVCSSWNITTGLKKTGLALSLFSQFFFSKRPHIKPRPAGWWEKLCFRTKNSTILAVYIYWPKEGFFSTHAASLKETLPRCVCSPTREQVCFQLCREQWCITLVSLWGRANAGVTAQYPRVAFILVSQFHNEWPKPSFCHCVPSQNFITRFCF